MKKLTGLARIVVGLLVLAIVAGGLYYYFSGDGTKKVTARFAAAVGIYPGTPVRILGVNVGEVESVKPEGSYVAVKMTYDSKFTLPANAGAVEVANSLVSDRYIQLTPVYRGGNGAGDGATIPTKRTAAPAELDDIYAALNKLSVALGPAGVNKGGPKSGALSQLVDVAAANLKGNGAALGNSITQVVAGRPDAGQQPGEPVRHRAQPAEADHRAEEQRHPGAPLQHAAGQRDHRPRRRAQRPRGGAAPVGHRPRRGQRLRQEEREQVPHRHQGPASILQTVVNNKNSVNEALAVAPVALANLVHAYDPKLGVIGTRSNLASLTGHSLPETLTKVCQTLVSAAGTSAFLGQLGQGLSGSAATPSRCVAALGVVPSTPTPTGGDGRRCRPLGGLVGGTP